MMKNGIYLTLILFLGTLGYQAIETVLMSNEMLLGGLIFFVVSVAIGFLTTHYKRRVELVAIQKIINVTFIGLFTLYGVFTGFALVMAAQLEGALFLAASLILIYSLVLFMKEKLHHHA